MSFSREFAKAAKKEIAPQVGKIKRPKTPYIIFTMEARASVISDKPTITFGEISKELGKRWKAMSDAQKAPYVKLSEVEKEQWLKLKEK